MVSSSSNNKQFSICYLPRKYNASPHNIRIAKYCVLGIVLKLKNTHLAKPTISNTHYFDRWFCLYPIDFFIKTSMHLKKVKKILKKYLFAIDFLFIKIIFAL
jgi:hypothetical protein